MADPGTEPPKGEEEPLDHGYKAPRTMVRKGKDWNLALIIRIVLFFGLVFFSLTTIAVFTVGLSLKMLPVFAAVAAIATIAGGFLVERLGGGLGGFMSGWGGRRRPSADLTAEIQKARVSKSAGDFETALRAINGVLKEEPDNGQALLLKAAILWEGYGNEAAARGYLKKVLEKTEPGDTLSRWARDYRDRMSRASSAREES